MAWPELIRLAPVTPLTDVWERIGAKAWQCERTGEELMGAQSAEDSNTWYLFSARAMVDPNAFPVGTQRGVSVDGETLVRIQLSTDDATK